MDLKAEAEQNAIIAAQKDRVSFSVLTFSPEAGEHHQRNIREKHVQIHPLLML